MRNATDDTGSHKVHQLRHCSGSVPILKKLLKVEISKILGAKPHAKEQSKGLGGDPFQIATPASFIQL